MIMNSHCKMSVVVLVAALMAGCTRAPNVAVVPASGPTAASAMTNDVKWSRVSAEHRAMYLQTFKAAGNRLATLAADHATGSWGVIMDADETIIDNSEYELGRVPFGGSFDAAGWTAWVMQGRAPALPGAVAFVTRVHDLGGKVVIVTNRNAVECPATRTNLERDSLLVDLVLCKADADDKNPRFDAVQNGTAAPDFPAITVLEWLGDNIQDFPHLTQAIRNGADSAFARFGDSFFVLPNVMYGSWQSNPAQ
jgi:5'-nucleotidase (lipoprotein e(P4) family)